MKIDALTKMNLNLKGAENIDARYFKENGDGTYSPTDVLKYNIIRDALNYYKEQVFQLDSECKFHTETLAEFKDTWQEKLNKEERERKYGPQLKELEKRKKEWREENSEKCDVYAGGPDLGDIDEMRYFAGYNPDVKPSSLISAVSLYKYLKEYDTDSLKADLPQKPEYLRVKKEYASEYKGLCDKWAEELGIPIETEEVGKIERTKFSIARLNNKNMKAVSPSEEGLEEYVEGLISYLTSMDKAEFKKRREEKDTLVDRDFVLEFNDRAKELKAIEIDEHTGLIEIFTKASDESSPIKIISLGREDAKDDFHKFILDVEVDGETLRYTRKINTKADLRKALETAIGMIEGTSFEKYSEDLDNFVNSVL